MHLGGEPAPPPSCAHASHPGGCTGLAVQATNGRLHNCEVRPCKRARMVLTDWQSRDDCTALSLVHGRGLNTKRIPRVMLGLDL